MKVLFLHPNLGIGGAERLVVDAAVGLQKRGHDIEFWTGYHSKEHCFTETKDGTLKVNVLCGGRIPSAIFGKLHVLLANLKMLLIAFWVAFTCSSTDVFIVDQVPTPLFVLWLFGYKTFFYCHFPDKLCDSTINKDRSFLRRIYRKVFDSLEEFLLSYATVMVCNSGFTLETTRRTFPSLKKLLRGKQDILNPPVSADSMKDEKPEGSSRFGSLQGTKTIVSLNRFERKKNIILAVQAFQELLNSWPEGKDCKLIIAGGYDPNLLENVEHHQELQDAAKKAGLQDKVTFVTSATAAEKYELLHNSAVILYTPTQEHFGIVPIEAMYCGTPVVAVNAAGPMESVLHEETGILAEPTPSEFAKGIAFCLNPENKRRMVEVGRKHVISKFSQEAFSKRLEDGLSAAMGKPSGPFLLRGCWFVCFALVLIILLTPLF